MVLLGYRGFDFFFFTLDELGYTHWAFQHFRLSNILVLKFFCSRCVAHLFIYCQCRYHVTVTSSSVFYVYKHCLQASENN